MNFQEENYGFSWVANERFDGNHQNVFLKEIIINHLTIIRLFLGYTLRCNDNVPC